jgi:hypothetical protein
MKIELQDKLAKLAVEAQKQGVHLIGCLVDYPRGTSATFGTEVSIQDGQGGSTLHTLLDAFRQMILAAQLRELSGTAVEHGVYTNISELLCLWTNATHHDQLEYRDGKWQWIE